MKVFRRKLIFSFVALAMIVVCLTSTTYAWFAKNSYAYISNFDINIENPEGILISVDGETFYQRISRNDVLKAAIVKKENLDFDNPILNPTYVENEFITKYRLSDVTTNDLLDFKEVDPNSSTDGYYNLKEANKYHYLKFDLYFKILTDNSDRSIYDLCFVPEELTSTLGVGYSSVTSESVTGIVATPFSTLEKEYTCEEKVTFNPADAMRVGLYNIAREESYVFEPNQGISSYAIEGGTGRYNPLNNPALQYLNSYSKYKLAPLKKTEEDKFDYEETYKVFNDTKSLGTFEKDDNKGYNIVKLEMSIWLEGYDGDYIAATGATVKPVSCYFSFYKKARKL